MNLHRVVACTMLCAFVITVSPGASAQDAKEYQPGQKIVVRLDVPEGVSPSGQRPITFGVPFPAGAVRDAGQVRLVDGTGVQPPQQTEVTARWTPDGPIKWLRFDALVVPARGCFVEMSAPRSAPPGPALTVSAQGDDQVTVDTGEARYVLAKGSSPISEVRDAQGRRIAWSARGLFVVDQKGRVATASADEETMAVEARGPVASSVRFEGWYKTADGEKLARHITRIECFAGQASASVTHTLVLSRNTNEVWFKEVGWELGCDPGATPQALFAKNRADSNAVHVQTLDGAPGAYMLQDQHWFFKHGRNHFVISTLTADDAAAPVAEGEEIGDWAALQGAAGGLAVACKDAARQHPKEFEIRRDRYILRLFSNRAGEELDFRSSTLVKKWDLATWYEKTHPPRRREKGFVEKVAKLPSNAIGWAKTHHLLFVPLSPSAKASEIAEAASLHANPIYALVDPWAIYASKAMGPVYPSDPERFPVVEKAVIAAFHNFTRKDAGWGEHGFIDYFAGPHLRYDGEENYGGMFRYNWGTYTFRSDLWTVYARTGNREVRAFAEGTNRTFMDAILAHWDGKETVRGLHRANAGVQSELPFYWGDRVELEVSSTSNHDNMINFYYLTGYRRAKDCMLEYAEGIQRAWTPEKAAKTWRPIMLFRLLTQAYRFTFDPKLKGMAEVTFQRFADPETALGLSKEFRPYESTSYKTNVDVRALLEAWDVFGQEQYRTVARKLADYWWQLLGTPPIIYTNPQPRIGWFLYNETGKPVYAEMLALQLRRMAQTYDPEKDAIRPETGLAAHSVAFYFEGVPYVLDAITRAGADARRLTSWFGCDDSGQEASIIVRKKATESIEVQVAVDPGDEDRTEALGGAQVVALNPKNPAGLNVLRVTENAPDFQGYHSGSTQALIPKDAPGADYEILPSKKGTVFAIAGSKVPLVLYAPRYWLPTLRQTPAERYYFSVLAKPEDAQIFFEGSARLFQPDDAPAFGGEPQHGWVSLPSGKPGVWGFEPVENMLVRVRNLPPFFAMGDKANYFEAAKPWSREAKAAAPKSYPREAKFGSGAIDSAGNQAVFLTGNRAVRIEAGKPHPSGNGTQFLPSRQGTIEFWMKPVWSSVELMTPEVLKSPKPLLTKRFAFGPMDAPDSDAIYGLEYNLSGSSKQIRGSFLTDGKDGRVNMRSYHGSALFERDEWVHVAWVWGRRLVPQIHGTPKEILMGCIYLNGRRGKAHTFRYENNLPMLPMTMLYIGYPSASSNMDAFVDELRISDVQRYSAEFAPPRRDVELALDEHTRALFHFNGDLKGSCSGFNGDVPAKFEEK